MMVTPSLTRLIAKGESATLELKRSTGELREALQTLCAFANGQGGRVVLGVKPNGELVGQQVSAQTFHEVAAARDRFEPPIEFEVEGVALTPGRSALVLTVAGARDSVPFTFDGRAFERVGNTTRKMAQERYEALLLERGQSRRRWENQPDEELSPKELDRDEVFRIVRIIRSMGRLAGPVGKSLPDALDRLDLRKDGRLLRAADHRRVFYRTGLIEKWGRGTNRVAEMCRAAGIAPPEFEEITGAAVVTFRVPVAGARSGEPESQPESQPESRPESASLAVQVLLSLEAVARGKAGISAALGQREISGPLNAAIRQLKADRMIEMTIPDKPNSRLQKYRLTAAGRELVGRLPGAPWKGS